MGAAINNNSRTTALERSAAKTTAEEAGLINLTDPTLESAFVKTQTQFRRLCNGSSQEPGYRCVQTFMARTLHQSNH